MKTSQKNNHIRNWIRKNGCDGFASFDFKNNEIILYDGSFFSIKKKTRIHRKRRKSEFGKDIKIDRLACAFLFDSIDDTIDYLTKAKELLNSLGYKTSGTAIPELSKDL